MAVSSSIPPVALIQTLMVFDTLEAMARASRFLRRRRTIQPVDFLYVLLGSPPPRKGVTIAGFWKKFCDFVGFKVARSNFTQRFGPGLDLWLMRLLQRATAEARNFYVRPTGPLARFRQVIARDATLLTIPHQLRWVWPGTRKQAPAAIKLHTDVRVLDHALLNYNITPGKTHDLHGFPNTPWQVGALYLLDRGYPSVAFWQTIHTSDAYFLTPLKSCFKPLITAVHGSHPAAQTVVVGTALKEAAVSQWWGKDFDVQATFWVRKPPHNQRLFQVTHRVVGVWNPQRNRHHFYVTNIPVDWGAPRELSQWYRLRWEVELAYKVGKGGLGLGDIKAQKLPAVQALIRAALLRGVLTSRAWQMAQRHLDEGWINPLMWACSWPEWLWDIIRAVPVGRTTSHEAAWAYMAEITKDPNRKHRVPTRNRLQQDAGNTS